jgi:chromate transporter
MIFLQLFWTYIKIGLFNFGGGYAMLSLIQHEVVERHGWISTEEFTDIVAISQMTPGPIGINSATYVGYASVLNAGYSPGMAVIGSAVATISVCLPSLVFVLMICRAFERFRSNKYVEAAFTCLRPASVGLIAAAALMMTGGSTFFDLKSVAIFAVAFLAALKFKVHPILIIVLAAAVGVIVYQ